MPSPALAYHASTEPAPDPWQALGRELDAWRQAGRVATLWLRDDDAVDATPSLDRLLASARSVHALVAVAVVPASASAALARRLLDDPNARVLQHGWSHAASGAPGAKKAELGDDRPAGAAAADLAAGRRRLADLFGAQALPVLVPPWNRIGAAVEATLPALGFVGLSTFGARAIRTSTAGLVRVNTHVDIVDWHGSRGFVGDPAAIDAAVGHLLARRAGRVDPDEATGLLTHHLVHDAACWRFLDRFLAATAGHPAARWCDPAALFAAPA